MAPKVRFPARLNRNRLLWTGREWSLTADVPRVSNLRCTDGQPRWSRGEVTEIRLAGTGSRDRNALGGTCRGGADLERRHGDFRARRAAGLYHPLRTPDAAQREQRDRDRG